MTCSLSKVLRCHGRPVSIKTKKKICISARLVLSPLFQRNTSDSRGHVKNPTRFSGFTALRKASNSGVIYVFFVNSLRSGYQYTWCWFFAHSCFNFFPLCDMTPFLLRPILCMHRVHMFSIKFIFCQYRR